MRAIIFSDNEYQTGLFKRLEQQTISFLNGKGFEADIINIGRSDLAFCMGCFGCWVKKPGECVINDGIAKINNAFVNSDVAVFLSPIVFGQFSANIKNVLDRWIPNILPFFIKRPDGSTMHPARYDAYPMQIIIGYGDNISDEDTQLFSDITLKHRRNAEVLIYLNAEEDITQKLAAISLERVGGVI